MSQLSTILATLVLIMMVIGMVYTYRIRQNQQGEYDSPVNTKVREHPYTRNPVFLTFFVFALVTFGYLLFIILNG